MAVTNPFDQKRGYQFGIEIAGEQMGFVHAGHEYMPLDQNKKTLN